MENDYSDLIVRRDLNYRSLCWRYIVAEITTDYDIGMIRISHQLTTLFRSKHRCASKAVSYQIVYGCRKHAVESNSLVSDSSTRFHFLRWLRGRTPWTYQVQHCTRKIDSTGRFRVENNLIRHGPVDKQFCPDRNPDPLTGSEIR